MALSMPSIEAWVSRMLVQYVVPALVAELPKIAELLKPYLEKNMSALSDKLDAAVATFTQYVQASKTESDALKAALAAANAQVADLEQKAYTDADLAKVDQIINAATPPPAG